MPQYGSNGAVSNDQTTSYRRYSMNIRTMVLVSRTIVLVSACIVFPPQAATVEPEAGSWQTWVVTDVAAIRPPAPPDQATTQAEIAELKTLAAQRHAMDVAQGA